MSFNKTLTGRLPDFFIIGAAKSGTSALFNYLVKHPQVFMPAVKETEYYSRDSVFSRGEGWYKNLFVDAEENQLCGEASTTYSRWPHTPDAAARIHHDAPRARLIYILRHPVERTYSHYAHHMRRGITMTFEEALDRDGIYVDCSMYMKQIERYLRFFPKERFLILFQDRLRNDPETVLGSVERHLGLSEIDLTTEGRVTKNVSGSDFYLRSQTTEKLKKFKALSWVADRIPPGIRKGAFSVFKKSCFGKRLEAQYRLPPLTDKTREELLRLFEEPNKNLEDFLGAKLPEWRS